MKRSSPLHKTVAILAVWTLAAEFVQAQTDAADNSESAVNEQFDKLADRYHQILLRRPRQGRALDLLVQHYLDAGKLDDLSEHYRQVVNKQPKKANAHLALGLILQRQGQDTEALDAYQRAAELDPDDF